MRAHLKGIRLFLVLLLGLTLLSAISGMAGASEVRLTSDTLIYDPASRLVRAEGNVRLDRQGLNLTSAFAEGDPAGERFRAWGSVKARWSEQKMELAAEEVSLVERAPRLVSASGNVLLTRPQERLSASSLDWVFGPVPEYVARGGVRAEMPGRVLEAEEAGRKGDRFWASKVLRFEDRREKISMKAGRVEALTEGEELRELTASGQVSAVVEGADGTPVRLRGDRLLYSKSKGTVALVGSAEAVQSGRSVRSESILYDLSSRRIEAQGRPQLTFTPGKEKKEP
ncbi:MAG: LptA/OstA family protein [Synergistales bacterium]